MNSDLTKELKLFYASISLYNFASSIVQIFIPIYLFEKGFPITDILLFFALMQAGRLVALPVAAYLSSNFGAKKIIGVAFIFQIIYFLFLRNVDIEHLSGYFLASALTLGAVWAFYWLPYLVHVSKISPDKKRGEVAGKINIYSVIASALGPLLGGLIIAKYGFGYAFAAAILPISFAVIALLSTPEVSKIRKIDFRSVSLRKIWPDLVANGFFNFQNFVDFTWIIFIFIIVPRYGTFGFIQTVSLAVSIIGLYFIGVWTDRVNRKRLLFFGSVANTAVWLLRPIANSFQSVFLFVTATNFTYPLERIPWNVKLQEHMDQEARTEYMAIFEIGGTLITLVGLVLFAFLIKNMPLEDMLFYGIIASALSGLGVNLVRK